MGTNDERLEQDLFKALDDHRWVGPSASWAVFMSTYEEIWLCEKCRVLSQDKRIRYQSKAGLAVGGCADNIRFAEQVRRLNNL